MNRKVFLAILAMILLLTLALTLGPRLVPSLATRPGSDILVPARTTVPSNPAGMENDFGRLTPETEGPCKGLYKIPGTDLCTHGPDPAPPGVDIKTSVPPIKP